MDKRIITYVAFVIMVIVQLYIPISMTLSSEKILKNGTTYKFKALPIDPTDPFRGKYITLRFQENRITVQDTSQWNRGEQVYLQIENDSTGYAKVKSIKKELPDDLTGYLKAKVKYNVYHHKNSEYRSIQIEYPFERFYMEESKAYDAETAYRKASRDSTQQAYALIKVVDGNSVIEDFYIDDIPIIEYLKAIDQ